MLGQQLIRYEAQYRLRSVVNWSPVTGATGYYVLHLWFPVDFMFQLTEDEWESLRSQIVISKNT